MDSSLPKSNLHQPREAPAGPKVRVRPRQVTKPQAANSDVALDAETTDEASVIRFQCPACFGMLTVPLADGYDGAPAPCPLCLKRITAPRIAPEQDARISASEKKACVFRPDRRRADFRFGDKNPGPKTES